MGLVLGFIFMLSVYWIFRRSAPQPVDRLFRRCNWSHRALLSLGHGAPMRKNQWASSRAHCTGRIREQVGYGEQFGDAFIGPLFCPLTQPSLQARISAGGAS
jgi:hypothetical protein